MQNAVEGTIRRKQVAINIFVLKCMLSSVCPRDEHACGSPFELVTYHCLGFLTDCVFNQ